MAAADELDESIFRYVWRHSRPQQIWLFAVLLVSLPFLYLTLDLPKRIVNGPIQGDWAPGQTETLFAVSLPLPGFLGKCRHPLRKEARHARGRRQPGEKLRRRQRRPRCSQAPRKEQRRQGRPRRQGPGRLSPRSTREGQRRGGDAAERRGGFSGKMR